ncbi:MAG TPA: hypothetical protein VGL57_01145 [Solirubrobacteraceae bacterium]|jgi:hypothetical protein
MSTTTLALDETEQFRFAPGGTLASLAQEAHRALRATGIDLAPRAWRSMFFIRYAGSVGIGFTHGSI